MLYLAARKTPERERERVAALGVGRWPAKGGREEELSTPEKAEEVAVFGMSVEEPPEWLPDGWTMEVRRGKNGNIYRYYTSPVSSYTFCSKEAVMRYLNVVKVDGHESEISACSGDESPRPVRQVKNSFKWLPPGWLLEIRTQRRGSKAQQIYMSYFEPSTGSRFYSKGDVLQFVKSGKIYGPTSDQTRHCEAESLENVIAQIEFYPDGLPHGWYKEIRIKKNRSGFRRDPYYADPESGYVFRTLKDVQRYTETGEISKHAFRPRKRSLYDKYSFEEEDPLPSSANKLESPGIAVRRCLFSGQMQNSNGEAVIDTDELDEKPNLSSLDHASLPYFHGSSSVGSVPNINHAVEENTTKSERMSGPVTGDLSEPAEHSRGMENKERNEVLMPAFGKSDSIQRFKKKAKKGRPRVLKRERFIKKPSEPANRALDSLEWEQLDLGDEIQPVKPSEMSDKEPNEPADMAPEQLLIEYPTQWEDAESLEQENGVLPEGELLGKNMIQGPEQKLLLEPEDVKKSSPSEKKQAKPDGGAINGGSSKAKTRKAAAQQPRRASKRLAGLEAGPPADDLRICYRFRWAMSKLRTDQTKDIVVLEDQETEEQNGEAALGEQAGEAGEPTDDKVVGSPLTLSFGDSWPDPCLEFAFKTLAGDIPVLEESLEIQNFLDRQLSSVQNSNKSVLASSAFAASPESSSQAELPVKPGSPDKICSSSREEESPSPTKNRLQSSGKVIRQYRRGTKLNQ
ncbi:uncharacterized protein LOC103708650 [Phoenix dactylifera]|uniref:Uncharacterized protein LOC103708650 n=1 Tax=Phoenix dactylifera TaxID=42345 RepID=A0A8B7C559_PHODC|nr:uncharacterized protein LOC103708650 [Phoenix dactylifera]